MKTTLTSLEEFSAEISLQSSNLGVTRKKFLVRLPAGIYKVRKINDHSLVLDFPVFKDYISNSNELVKATLYPRIRKAHLDLCLQKNEKVQDYIVKRRFKVRASSDGVYYNYPSLTVQDAFEENNILLADFDQMVLDSWPSSFDDNKSSYCWEDKNTGSTRYDGVSGIPYSGQAPPYHRNMNLLHGIYFRISKLRGRNNKPPEIMIGNNHTGIIFYPLEGAITDLTDCDILVTAPSMEEAMYLAAVKFVKAFPGLKRFSQPDYSPEKAHNCSLVRILPMFLGQVEFHTQLDGGLGLAPVYLYKSATGNSYSTTSPH